MRAQKLYELYRAYNSLEEIPAAERASIEKTIFRDSLDNIWQETCQFFAEIDPTHITRGERDPKHKMALVFRWYLGLSSRWANAGEADRQMDYQIWCGPAMGAFNEWTKGTYLEQPANRRVADVGMNILHGAGVITRINALRQQANPDQTRIAAFNLKASQFQKLTEQRGQQLDATRQKQVQRLYLELQPVLQQVFQQKQCSMLLEREGIVIGVNPAMDLTQAAILGLNGRITTITFDLEPPGATPPGQQ